MDKKQLCATIPSGRYNRLCSEVANNGSSAISNRKNKAVLLREHGHVKSAELAEMEAEIMTEIAGRQGLRIK